MAKRRPVGIDLAKWTMEMRVLEGGKIGRRGLTTDEKGWKILVPLLRKTDVAGCKVRALNPETLRIIKLVEEAVSA
jgi:hypothetical protein